MKRQVLKSKDGPFDPSFPVIKDQTQFSVAHACYSKGDIALPLRILLLDGTYAKVQSIALLSQQMEPALPLWEGMVLSNSDDFCIFFNCSSILLMQLMPLVHTVLVVSEVHESTQILLCV
ncbi:hypothetical protein M9H77_35184 [Catharanthus roseus]|uniref:Uncharacterized protein n=1 Tax=Catharanthus roseus TaxID=4058 RepID=A0ACB9ZP70_CATRO|nr:hypothetical protein M9H77_35184 [Catharanthus roseus]